MGTYRLSCRPNTVCCSSKSCPSSDRALPYFDSYGAGACRSWVSFLRRWRAGIWHRDYVAQPALLARVLAVVCRADQTEPRRNPTLSTSPPSSLQSIPSRMSGFLDRRLALGVPRLQMVLKFLPLPFSAVFCEFGSKICLGWRWCWFGRRVLEYDWRGSQASTPLYAVTVRNSLKEVAKPQLASHLVRPK